MSLIGVTLINRSVGKYETKKNEHT